MAASLEMGEEKEAKALVRSFSWDIDEESLNEATQDHLRTALVHHARTVENEELRKWEKLFDQRIVSRLVVSSCLRSMARPVFPPMNQVSFSPVSDKIWNSADDDVLLPWEGVRVFLSISNNESFKL